MVDPEQVVLEQSGFSKELEEELHRDTSGLESENEPIGCWKRFTSTLYSKKGRKRKRILFD